VLACDGGVDGLVGRAGVDGVEVVRVWVVVFLGGGGCVGVGAGTVKGGDVGPLVLGVLGQQRDRVGRLGWVPRDGLVGWSDAE
jgi:hypothetical protein